jgi:glucosamine kinase
MILVADSGSSKTDWMAYSPEKNLTFNTQGINPYFLNAQEIVKILTKNKELADIASEVKDVYFFGAGCLNPDKREIVSNGLSAFFKNAFISVDHDLMGSAYATCGDKKGLACILGTGSNIAYYDGNTVYTGNHGLGYILGDEGSGTFFGKKMVVAYLHKTMPTDLLEKFEETFHVTKEIVVENVYQKPFPNSYLASFSRFMIQHKHHPFIQQVLKDGFQEFIDTNVKTYKDYESLECNFVGSISYYYQEELRAVFAENNLEIGKTLQKPIEGIFDYILKREGILDKAI